MLGSLVAAVVFGGGGCAFDDGLEVGHSELLSLVSDYVDASCSTGAVLPLSMQVAEEVSCMAPDALGSFAEGDGITFSGSAVIPYLSPDAARDLESAAAAGGDVQINSAYRTVVQQYLLYQWYLQGRCGITAAALPGRSNHESGRAVDVGNYGAARGALNNAGWAQTVLPSDPVHYDHLDSPDLRGTDILGFQRLWNRNHPDDLIDEDGLYGPMTSMALRASPAEGFADAGCSASDLGGELVALDAPSRLYPGFADDVVVTLENTGDKPWPAEAILATAMPRARDSDFFDPESWDTPRQVTALGRDVAPGDDIEIAFSVVAPDGTAAAAVTESFQLQDADGLAFGPVIQLDLEVAGEGDPGDPNAPGSNLAGGCSAAGGGGGGGLAAMLLVVVGLAFRRRRFAVAAGSAPAQR